MIRVSAVLPTKGRDRRNKSDEGDGGRKLFVKNIKDESIEEYV